MSVCPARDVPTAAVRRVGGGGREGLGVVGLPVCRHAARLPGRSAAVPGHPSPHPE